MPWKAWNPGEELLAADVTDYLGNQSVATFASSAERASAYPSPPEGALTFLRDTDRLEVWRGAAWELPANIPRGEAAALVKTVNAEVWQPEGDCACTLGPITLPAGRIYHLQLNTLIILPGINESLSVFLTHNGAKIAQADFTTALRTGGVIRARVTPSAGSHTFAVRAVNATYPTTYTLTDVGAV